jgi:hypothetical protein
MRTQKSKYSGLSFSKIHPIDVKRVINYLKSYNQITENLYLHAVIGESLRLINNRILQVLQNLLAKSLRKEVTMSKI